MRKKINSTSKITFTFTINCEEVINSSIPEETIFTYTAEQGMTWEDWYNSDYNLGYPYSIQGDEIEYIDGHTTGVVEYISPSRKTCCKR